MAVLSIPLLLLLQVVVVVVNGRLATYVNFHIPHHLHIDGGYKHRIGHFGDNPIGFGSHREYGSMALHVYLSPSGGSDLCHLKDVLPPSTMTTTAASSSATATQYIPPFMMLTHRGNCTFVTKARHAQLAGAAALLIVDDKCMCSDTTDQCVAARNFTPCQLDMPVVASDGSGSDVSIPTILITKVDAGPIVQAIQAAEKAGNGAILMDIRWGPASTTVKPMDDDVFADTKVVYYGMWVDLYDNHTAPLMQQVKPIALSLLQHHKQSKKDKKKNPNADIRAQFYPSYMLFNGSQSQCQDNTGQDACFQVCTNQGRYCYPSHHVPGSMIVTEILHRLCLWKHHGDTDAEQMANDLPTGGQAWWDYITYFDTHCRVYWRETAANNTDTTAHDKYDKCVKDAYQYAKIGGDEVANCIKDSGGLDDDNENALLEQQLQSQTEYGLLVAPTVWANGHALHWQSPTAMTILETICAEFLDEPIDVDDNGNPKNHNNNNNNGMFLPEICQKCQGLKSDSDVVSCAEKHGGMGSGSHSKAHHHVIRTLFWIIISLGIVTGIVYVAYQRIVVQGQMGIGSPSSLSEGLRYALLSDQRNSAGPPSSSPDAAAVAAMD